MLYAGGAAGAKGIKGNKGKGPNAPKVDAPDAPRPPSTGGTRKICKRSIMDQTSLLYSNEFRDLPDDLKSLQLPGSFSDFDLSHQVTSSTPELVNSVLSIVLIIKLLISGHPKSKPYAEEICRSAYANLRVEECGLLLMSALQKYDDNSKPELTDPNETFFDGILDSLVFEAKVLTSGSKLGHDLITSICLNVKGTLKKILQIQFQSLKSNSFL